MVGVGIAILIAFCALVIALGGLLVLEHWNPTDEPVPGEWPW